jgi:DNA-binding response OmpR family regulator
MAKQSVLLIDDSAVVLAAAEYALTGAGYDVTTALTLDELATITPDAFDLILMDVEMPELFGDDVASVLRHQRGVKTPIYLFSSVAAAELAVLVRDAALDGFISKQDGVEAMVKRVRGILG